MRSITDKKKKAQTWDLSHLLAYAKLLHVRIPRLSDELTIRESKEIIEKCGDKNNRTT